MTGGQNASTGWATPVARFCVWGAPGTDNSVKPDVDFVAPMLRRRLSPLARAALHVAYACAGEVSEVRLVYASRHGELGRTLELLQCIAGGESLSPTTFSLSVLNSAAGIYSIARNDHSPATAIAAGDETFGYGLLEAHARATLEPGAPVLYVYADAPVPSPFGPQTDDPEGILAIAMLIDPAADGVIHCNRSAETPTRATNISQAAAFLPCLSDRKSTWSSSSGTWNWTRE